MRRKLVSPGTASDSARCRWLPRSCATQLPRDLCSLVYTLGKRSTERLHWLQLYRISHPPPLAGEVRFDARVVNKPDRPHEHTSREGRSCTCLRSEKTEGNRGVEEGVKRSASGTVFTGFSFLGFSLFFFFPPPRLAASSLPPSCDDDLDYDPCAVTLVIG